MDTSGDSPPVPIVNGPPTATTSAVSAPTPTTTAAPAPISTTTAAAPAPTTTATTSTTTSVPQSAGLSTHFASGTSTWVNLKCLVCGVSSLANENDVYNHYLEHHCFDGVPMVNANVIDQQELTTCPHCNQLFKRGLVHPNGKCRIQHYQLSAKFTSSRKAAMQGSFTPASILNMEFGTHLLLPDAFFTMKITKVNQLSSNIVLQEDFRLLFIIAVRAIQLASSDNQAAIAWSFLLQLPLLVLSNKSTDQSVSQSLVSVFKNQTRTLLNSVLQSPRQQGNSSPRSSTLDPDDVIASKATTMFLSTGQIGKASDRITDPVMPLDYNDPDVARQVDNLLLPETHITPEEYINTLSQEPPSIPLDSVSTAVHHFKNSAPGITGWSPQLIKHVASSTQGMEAVTFLVNRIFSRAIPDVIYSGLTRQALLPLSKGAKPGVRPIMLSDCWMRLMESCVAQEIPELAHNFQPLQMAIGAPGGSEDIVHLVRATLDAHPQWIAVKTDFANAYGTLSRHAVFDRFRNSASSASGQLTKWYINLHLSSPTSYLTSNGEIHHYNRGIAQGSPMSMFLFCYTIHPALIGTNNMLQSLHQHSGLVLALADDTTFVGPPSIAFQAALHYASCVSHLGLSLNSSKSEVLCISPASLSAAQTLAAQHSFAPPQPLITILGAPVGRPDLEAKAVTDQIKSSHFDRLNLMNDPQSQLLLLRYSLISKYMFLTRCVPPNASEAALVRLNSHVSESLANILGIPTVSSRVFDIASMPLAVGGLGLTNLHAIRHTAYFASAAHAIHTWSQHFGATHPIIAAWTGKQTRTSIALEQSLQHQFDIMTAFNTGKIAVQPRQGANNANLDKADPEGLLPAVSIPTLPQSIAALTKAGQNTSTKLQRDLSHLFAVVQFRRVWKATTQQDSELRTQLLANTVKSTNLWLRVTPDNLRFRFTPFEFRLNLLQHFALDKDINILLGLDSATNPADAPPSIPCVCTNNDFRINDGPRHTAAHPQRQHSKRATYSHLINCIHKNAYQYRHTSIVDVCADATRAVNLHPELELQVSIAPPVTGNNNQKLEKKRFDVTVGGIAPLLKTLQVDVSVTSHRQTEEQFRTGCARYPMYAADSKVKEKLAKYADCVFPDSEVVVPLVCETSGAIHSNFQKFFASLALRVDNHAPPAATWTTPTFITYWMAVTSCTLRRETAKSLQRLARAALRSAANPSADDHLPPLIPANLMPSEL